jgi:hypothetical protein
VGPPPLLTAEPPLPGPPPLLTAEPPLPVGPPPLPTVELPALPPMELPPVFPVTLPPVFSDTLPPELELVAPDSPPCEFEDGSEPQAATDNANAMPVIGTDSLFIVQVPCQDCPRPRRYVV